MTDTPKRLCGPVLLTNAAATQYTVPDATQTIVRHIHVCNTHISAVHTFTLSIGVYSAGTALFVGFPISSTGVLDWSGFLVLDAGDIVQAFAGQASNINLTMSGIEVTG